MGINLPIFDEYISKKDETIIVEKQYDDVNEKNGVVDLEPYKIKNINNFYFRDHPKNLHPDTPKYKKYWANFAVPCVEGKWVNDEGTWYWIPPVSFFSINYLTTEDKINKKVIYFKYRDIDRILGRYRTCANGFSGFDGDEEYSCNVLIKQFNEGTIKKVHLKRLENNQNCYKTDNTLKTYIDSWEYLRRHYLIDNPAKKPLGRALYDNPLKNMMCLTARAVGKSTFFFVADFIHEWLFSDVKYREDLKKENINIKHLFGMASTDSANLKRSAALIGANMTRFPGSYNYPNTDGEKIPKCMGPYYKSHSQSWDTGKEPTHIEKDANGNRIVTSSMAQIRVVTPDKTKIFAGDRFRRIYIEEAGFMDLILDVHANSKDTLRLSADPYERVGAAVYLGTSGNLKSFRQANELFSNPDTYDIQAIPNYWSSSGKKIGLFIPSYYAERIYADRNENVDIETSFKEKLEYRAEYRKTASSLAYDKEVMYHPLEPKEMIRPSGESVLPKQEAQIALNNLEDFEVFKKRATVGKLEYDKNYPCGVRFDPDLLRECSPITSFSTNNLPHTRGAFIQYEVPVVDPPKDLYWVLYDPAAQSGEGTSLHSVIVYKWIYTGNELTLEDAIVGEWLGRLETLDENYAMVLKIARYYNAKIFPENNVSGFIEWANRMKIMNLLQPENLNLKREKGVKVKSSYWKKGFRMTKDVKGWALNKLSDWLLEVKEFDENGIPQLRNIDRIYSPRVLEEVVNYSPDDGNYDHISSLLGLMVLKNSLNHFNAPQIVDKYSNDDYHYPAADKELYLTPYVRKQRAKILNY